MIIYLKGRIQLKKFLVCLCLLMMVILVASCDNQQAIAPPVDESEIIGSVNGENVYRYEYNYYFDTFFNEYFNNYYDSLMEYSGVDLLDEESAHDVLGDMENWAWHSVIQASLIRQMAVNEYDLSLENNYYNTILTAGTSLSLNTNRYYSMIFPLIEAEAKAAKGIGEEEAKEYYLEDPSAWDCYKVAHIIITSEQMMDDAVENEQDLTEEEADAAAKERAEDIIAQLANGADFAELAAQYSADGSAETGGVMDLYFNISGNGISDEASFDPLFSEGAFLLKNIGDISTEPVQSSYGYHIIKLVDKKEGFEAVKDYVLDSMLAVESTEVNEFFANKLQGLEDSAEIECNLEFKYYVEPEPESEEIPEEGLPEEVQPEEVVQPEEEVQQ